MQNVTQRLLSASVRLLVNLFFIPAQVKIQKTCSAISAVLPLPAFVKSACGFCCMVLYSLCHEMLETSFLSLHLDESYGADGTKILFHFYSCLPVDVVLLVQ